MGRISKHRILFAAAVASAIPLIHTERAQADRYWVVSSGNWATAANWSATDGGAGGAGQPGATDNAFLIHTDGILRTVTYNGSMSNDFFVDLDNNGGGLTRVFQNTGSNLTARWFLTGDRANGRAQWDQSIGANTLHTYFILAEDVASKDCTYNLSGGNITMDGAGGSGPDQFGFFVGYGGNGILNHTGGTITAAANVPFVLGQLAGSTGTYTMNGAGALTTINNNLFIGGSDVAVGGTGVFHMLNGNMVIDGTLKVWDSAGTDVDMTGGGISLGAMDIQRSVTFAGGMLNVNGTGDISIATSKTVLMGSQLVGNNSLNKIGPGTLVLTSSANNYTGGTTVASGVLQVGNNGTTGVITGNPVVSSGAILRFSRSDTVTFSGLVSGAGTLSHQGAGRLVLNAASTYTGFTSIGSGILQPATGVNAIPDASIVNFSASSGLLDLSATSETFAGLTGGGASSAVDVGSGRTVTLNLTSSPQTFAGGITGSGALIKTGTGVQVLAGTSTHTGGTTISAGTLQLGDAFSNGTVAGNITNNATLRFNPTGTVTFNGNISGSGTVVQNGPASSKTVLGGTNTYGGTTTITNGTLQPAGGNAIPDTGTVNIDPGNPATFELNGASETIGALTGGNPSFNNLRLGSGAILTINSSGTPATFIGAITGAGGITKTGVGTFRLQNPSFGNTYTGVTTINQGTLELASFNSDSVVSGDLVIGDGVGAIGGDVVTTFVDGQIIDTAGHTVTINSTGLLNINGNSEEVRNLVLNGGRVATGPDDGDGDHFDILGTLTTNADAQTASITGLNPIRLAPSPSTLVINVADGAAAIDLDITTPIVNPSGTRNIQKTGAGSLRLNYVDPSSGPTTTSITMSAGTLLIGGDASPFGSQQLNFTDGIVAPSLTSRTLSLPISLGNGTPTFDTPAGLDLTLSGFINGIGGMTKTGPNALRLSGATGNSYLGATTLNEGTIELQKSSGNAIPASVTIGDGIGGTNADVVRLLLANQIGQSTGNTVTLTKSGQLDLNNFAETIYNLTMNGGGNIEIGTGNFQMNGTFTSQAGSTTSMINGVGRSFVLGGSAPQIFDVADGTASPDAIIFANITTPTAAVNKTGAGTLVFAGDATYTGGTTISAGKLQIGNNAASGTLAGNVVVNAGTLAFSRSDTYTFGGTISGGGAVVQDGIGTLVLTANNTHGSTTVLRGTLSVASNNNLGLDNPSNLLDVRGNATLKVNVASLVMHRQVLLGDNLGGSATLDIGAGNSLQLLGTGGTGINGPIYVSSGDAIFHRDPGGLVGVAPGATITVGAAGNLFLLGAPVFYDGVDYVNVVCDPLADFSVFDGAHAVGTVNGGLATVYAPASLSAQYLRLTAAVLDNGSTASIRPNGGATGVSRINTVNPMGTGKLDLSNNNLITHGPLGSWNGSAYTGVIGMIASGRNGNAFPLWDGGGIVTSQSSAINGNYTSLAVARASDIGISTTATWSGQSVTSSDVLVMYTYGGDATLDGKINIDDYIRIDSGIANGLTGWFNGDFNYDGKVNIDDYTTVIDANIGNQTGVFFGAPSGLSGGGGVVAVPEPVGIAALCVFGAFGAFRNRRRRKIGS